MNAKDILNNIFNKNCRIVVGNNHNHNHTKKYINNLNEELFKIECLGYIKKSDVIIGLNSTVMLEAMSINKKAIFLYLQNEFWRFKKSYIKDDIFCKAFNIEQLFLEINSIPKNSSENLTYYFNPNSQMSVNLIFNEIMSD